MTRFLFIAPTSLQAGARARACIRGEWTLGYASDALLCWSRERPGSALRVSTLQNGLMVGHIAAPAAQLDGLSRTWGTYVAVAESPNGQVDLIRDPTGGLPAFIAVSAFGPVVCSHLDDLAGLGCTALDIDWAQLARVMLGDYLPSSRTGLFGVEELPPGEHRRLEHGVWTRIAGWTPAASVARPFDSEPEALKAFRDRAFAVTDHTLAAHRAIAIDLSGGLDSSVVAGLVARSPNRPDVVCINAIVGHAESDERQFARAVAEQHGFPLVELDLADAIPDLAALPPAPLQPRPGRGLMDMGLGAGALAAAKAVGATAYLTGRGGDHVFFHGAAPWAATDFLRRTGNLLRWPSIAYQSARLSGRTLGDILANAFDRPTPDDRLATAVTLESPLVTGSARALALADATPHPWLREAVRSPLPGKFRQIRNLIELQRHYDRIERALELDELHPLMSQPLLEAGLQTPTEMFCAHGVRRWLQRETFKELLPEMVYRRRTKGSTTSRTVRTLIRNLPYVRALLLEGDLAARGLIDRAAAGQRLTPAALGEGKSHGVLVYALITALWLENAKDFLRAARVVPARPRTVLTPVNIP